jgi:uncharacterized LabA/DUF88 family protein
MGIRSDLASELRNLLSSEIIKGKVAVQRAYADWRRYPQYIVPLAESSIDMIMAPAYGSSKKNATDIRLSVDAIELVFTRPEIGTYILLSGDSDFASLVTKLKEYGKYVIGVGIRESSSDLLVMNCDEYYSYNALAGLVKSGEEEVVKWDPWELVVEAINRMVKNGDVMRSDRLKQVMQDIDPQFDEKNLGMSKFSKFCQEAAAQGLINVIKLENGQLEVAPADDAARAAVAARAAAQPEREERPFGRRGRRGRDRRDRADREAPRPVSRVPEPAAASSNEIQGKETQPASLDGAIRSQPRTSTSEAPTGTVQPAKPAPDGIGQSGERLTKEEAFDLVRRAALSLVRGDAAVPASTLRRRAFELLGRDSESLSERFFSRVLRDAHDADVIDLRRRGDDFEVSVPAQVAPVAEQLNRAAAARGASGAAPAPQAALAPVPRGMGPRGIPTRGRTGGRQMALPPDLLTVGVVEESASAPAMSSGAIAETASEPVAATREEQEPVAKPRRKRAASKTTRKSAAVAGDAGGKPAASPPKPRKRARGGASGSGGRGGKGTSSEAAA